jgi:hypothetical protein
MYLIGLSYIIVRVGKHLFDVFSIRNGFEKGSAVPPLLFNFALEHAIRRVQVNQDGSKLNGTHHLLVDAYDVSILGGSVYTIKENPGVLVVGCKEIGLKVNVDETKYIVISLDQNAGRSHNVKIDNNSFERLEELECLGTTLTNQNSMQEVIKSGLKPGNACCHSMQSLPFCYLTIES